MIFLQSSLYQNPIWLIDKKSVEPSDDVFFYFMSLFYVLYYCFEVSNTLHNI